MKRLGPLLVVAILLCAACHAHIRVAPGEQISVGSQSLADIPDADLEEKIARDLVTVWNVIDGLRALERRADETASVLGRITARVYTQAENDRIRALLQSYLNYRSILLRLLGYYSGYETVSREDLRLKSFLVAYVCGLTVFREGIGVDPKTHEGVKTMFSMKLISNGLIAQKYGKWFRNLLSEREDVDYADYVTVDAPDAEEALHNASLFIMKIKAVIRSVSKEL